MIVYSMQTCEKIIHQGPNTAHCAKISTSGLPLWVQTPAWCFCCWISRYFLCICFLIPEAFSVGQFDDDDDDDDNNNFRHRRQAKQLLPLSQPTAAAAAPNNASIQANSSARLSTSMLVSILMLLACDCILDHHKIISSNSSIYNKAVYHHLCLLWVCLCRHLLHQE